MKDPLKLQEKLRGILKGKSDIKVPLHSTWSEEQLKYAAQTVQNYVYQSGEVINDDPLHEWLEEYYFFLSETQK